MHIREETFQFSWGKPILVVIGDGAAVLHWEEVFAVAAAQAVVGPNGCGSDGQQDHAGRDGVRPQYVGLPGGDPTLVYSVLMVDTMRKRRLRLGMLLGRSRWMQERRKMRIWTLRRKAK